MCEGVRIYNAVHKSVEGYLWVCVSILVLMCTSGRRRVSELGVVYVQRCRDQSVGTLQVCN